MGLLCALGTLALRPLRASNRLLLEHDSYRMAVRTSQLLFLSTLLVASLEIDIADTCGMHNPNTAVDDARYVKATASALVSRNGSLTVTRSPPRPRNPAPAVPSASSSSSPYLRRPLHHQPVPTPYSPRRSPPARLSTPSPP